MKKIKGILLLVAIVLLSVLVFTACGNTDDGGKTQLATPSNLTISGTTLSWQAVPSAKEYAVDVDGTLDISDINQYSLADLTEEKTYSIMVMAIGDGEQYTDSSWSAVKHYTVGNTGGSEVDKDAAVTGVTGGTIENLTISYEVAETISDIDFSGIVSVSSGARWDLYADALGQTKIPTKIAAGLSDGLNTYYIVVTSADGNTERVFTLKIWKNYYAEMDLYVNDQLYDTELVLTHTTISSDTFPDAVVSGYTFEGWNCDGHYVVGAHRFDASVTAKRYQISFSVNQGTLSDETPVEVIYDEPFFFPLPTREGHTFDGWDYDNTLITNNNGDSLTVWSIDGTASMTVTANWTVNQYFLSVEKNIDEAGSISTSGGEYDYDTLITLTASTNGDYSWLGWYAGAEKISDDLTYSFNMPSKDINYTAKWGDFELVISRNRSEAGTINGTTGRVAAGTPCTVTATTTAYSNYTWLGWWDGDGNKVSDDLSYTFPMPKNSLNLEARWGDYTLSFYKDTSVMGNIVSGTSGRTVAGIPITVAVSTNDGYTFVGWYIGSDKVCDTLSYTFDMPYRSITLTAKWMDCPITLVKNPNYGGTVSGVEKTILDAPTTVTAVTNEGYLFMGWYENGQKISDGTSLTYQFTLTTELRTLTAKWKPDIAIGDGTEQNPYVIMSTQEYRNFVSTSPVLQGTYIVLGCDLDFNHTTIDTVEILNSHFDGNNHVMRNFSINSTGLNVGLFGNIYQAGVVRNLGLEDFTIPVIKPNLFSPLYVGAIAGISNGLIENCYAIGSISVTIDTALGAVRGYVGGLVGIGFTIRNSHTDVTVKIVSSSVYAATPVSGGGISGGKATITNCYATGDVIVRAIAGEAYAGGIAGTSATVTNSYATGTIISEQLSGSLHLRCFAGGVVGQNSNVTNCFATGNVTASGSSLANSYVGGINGNNHTDYTVENCWYYNGLTLTRYGSSATPNAYGTSCTAAQLETESFYLTTLFWSDEIWNLGDLVFLNRKFPMLK